MIDDEKLKKIEDELKKSSGELFGDKTEEIAKELEDEDYLGSPNNLLDRSDESES